MKNILPLVFVLAWQLSFCQTQTPSTVGQIYNFEVGDTFEYEWEASVQHDCPNYGGYIIVVITSKTITSDTTIYLYNEYATPVEQYPGDPCSPNSSGDGIGGYPLIVLNNDSSIFTIVGLYCGNSFTPDCFDSVFSDSLYNGRKQDWVYGALGSEEDYIYADSLGPVYLYFFGEDYGEFSAQWLVYYHKTTGETWGIPLSDTLFTSVNNLNNNLTALNVFPNPVNNAATVVYDIADWTSDATLIIVNELGQVVYNQPVEQYPGYKRIDVSKYGAGVYLVYIKQNEQAVAVQRFAKE